MQIIQLQEHIRYVLSMQTHKLHEARKRCMVYNNGYSATPSEVEIAIWKQQMSSRDIGTSASNLSAAVAELQRVEAQTQQWANRSMKPLMDWTRTPQGRLRRNDN